MVGFFFEALYDLEKKHLLQFGNSMIPMCIQFFTLKGFAKFGKKIDIYTATPVASLSTDELIKTFREVKAVNERFIEQLKICGNEISHHAYFKQVTTNEVLAEKFGNEMEACMNPLEAQFAPKLKAWNTYLDAIGKTQHEQLELYKIEVDKRAGQ